MQIHINAAGRRTVFLAAVFAFAAAAWSGLDPLFAEDLEIGRGSATIIIEQPRPPAPSPASPSPPSSMPRVEILQVIPLEGNNPFHPREPIRNTTVNGRTVLRAPDEREETPVTVEPPPPAGCVGMSYPLQPVANYSVAQLYLASPSSTCRLDTIAGNSLKAAVEFLVGQGPNPPVGVFTGAQSGWRLVGAPGPITPVPGAGQSSQTTFGGPHLFTLEFVATGVQVELSIRISGSGMHDAVLHVVGLK